jgi:hypothetical protein
MEPLLAETPAFLPEPPALAAASRWHGDGLIARSVRFALTVMAPIIVGLIVGVDIWLIYALVTCILAFTLDTGGPALHRLGYMGLAGVVVLLGTGIGTLAAGHLGLTVLAFACVGVIYALVESLHPSAAAAARFMCLTVAIGALYAPLQLQDIAVVAGFVIYAWAISLAWDGVTGLHRPSTAPLPREIFARLRGTERERWVFALAVAVVVPLAFLTSLSLGLHRPYWALIAIVLVLRADAMSSRRLMGQTLAGTTLGVAAALLYGYLLPYHAALLAGMAAAALLRWPAQQRHGTLGMAVLTVFIMLLLELVAGNAGGATHDMVERLVDMTVGCVFAMVALGLDRLGQALLRRWQDG